MLSGENSSNKTESQLHPLPKMLTPVYLAQFIYKEGHVPHLNFSLRFEGGEVIQGLLPGHIPITGEETEAQEGSGM